MPLLEMKNLPKVQPAPKINVSVLFLLFLIISRGHPLPQMLGQFRQKSPSEPKNKSPLYHGNVFPGEVALDLKNSNQLLKHERDKFRDDKDKKLFTAQRASGETRSNSERRNLRPSGDELLPENFKSVHRNFVQSKDKRDAEIQTVQDVVSNPWRQEHDAVKADPANDVDRQDDRNQMGEDRRSPSRSEGLVTEGRPEGDTERFPIDSILNDVHIGKGSENVIDYYFVDDAVLREGHHGHRLRHGTVKHGVIINLTGLIPSLDSEEPSDSASGTFEGRTKESQDEVLAFKAFEIRPSSSGGVIRLPTSSIVEADEHLVDEIGMSIDYPDDHKDGNNNLDVRHTSHKEEVTSVSTSAGTRSLSRKRRQKDLPASDDVDRQRRHFSRRRRRKRKRRHRHVARAFENSRDKRPADEKHSKAEVAEALVHDDRHERFLLKSNSPAYVITSASEVKKDWCKTVPFKQKVTEKNCKSRYITNNFCYGQCNSFFIPHVGRTGNGAAFQSCAVCKPYRYKWTTVTLSCPRQEQQKVEKRVLIVESCRCKSETLQ